MGGTRIYLLFGLPHLLMELLSAAAAPSGLRSSSDWRTARRPTREDAEAPSAADASTCPMHSLYAGMLGGG